MEAQVARMSSWKPALVSLPLKDNKMAAAFAAAKRRRSCRFCTFIQIHTWFLLEPSHFHPVFPNPFPLADDPSPLGDLHFYLLYIGNLSENSGLLAGDEIIDTMLFTCEQTFDKCHFIPVEFSPASTWWDSYPQKTHPEIPESPRWNQQVRCKKYTVSPASVALIEATPPPNCQNWKCGQQTWKNLSSNCLMFNFRCVNAI